MPDAHWNWPQNMTITVTVTPAVLTLWTRTLDFLDAKAQKQIDALTASLTGATQAEQKANTDLEAKIKENQ